MIFNSFAGLSKDGAEPRRSSWPGRCRPGRRRTPGSSSTASTSSWRRWRSSRGSGVKHIEVISSKLYAAHSEGITNMGFDIDGECNNDCLRLII